MPAPIKIDQKLTQWLTRQHSVNQTSLREAFKISEGAAKKLFNELIRQEYLIDQKTKRPLFTVNSIKFFQDKRGSWNPDLYKHITAFVKGIESQYNRAKTLTSYLMPHIDSLTKNQLHDRPLPTDPLYAFIEASESNEKTVFISDNLDMSEFMILIHSACTGIPIQNLMAGTLSDSDWPNFISTAAKANIWNSEFVHISRKSDRQQLTEIKRVLKMRFDVVILDLATRRDSPMWEKIFEQSKKDKFHLITNFNRKGQK